MSAVCQLTGRSPGFGNRAALRALTTSGDLQHAMDGPGWYAIQPTLLVTARADPAGRR